MKPEVLYEVWEERSGVKVRRNALGIKDKEFVRRCMESMNADEAESAHMERRPVTTRYFMVKATTTFEEV